MRDESEGATERVETWNKWPLAQIPFRGKATESEVNWDEAEAGLNQHEAEIASPKS
jgi:hypothetical protein